MQVHVLDVSSVLIYFLIGALGLLDSFVHSVRPTSLPLPSYSLLTSVHSLAKTSLPISLKDFRYFACLKTCILLLTLNCVREYFPLCHTTVTRSVVSVFITLRWHGTRDGA